MKVSSFQPAAFGQETKVDGAVIEGLDVSIASIFTPRLLTKLFKTSYWKTTFEN